METVGICNQATRMKENVVLCVCLFIHVVLLQCWRAGTAGGHAHDEGLRVWNGTYVLHFCVFKHIFAA